MKKNTEVYLEQLGYLLKEKSNESTQIADYGRLFKQSGKLNSWGKLLYFVQKDEYELINWPYDSHFHPEKGNLCAASFQKLIHEKDRNTIAKGKLQVLLLAKSMNPEEILNHKVEFYCRIKCLDGSYISMFFRCIGLELDADGDINILILNVLPISSNTSLTPVCGFKLININTDKSVLSLGRSVFPEKRLEVLKLTNKGLCTKEIALQLGKTIENINWHRKKILEQTGCYNMHGAINIAKEMGL